MKVNEQLDEVNSSKQLSLQGLFMNEKWNIEIPIIQRDYAQGRPSASDIRKTFVSTLLYHLTSERNIDLDFVYGSLKETDGNVFIPLDGQQRLTTLFLLYWYLAQKESLKTQFVGLFGHNNKSRFTYETRTSSREFCDSMVIHGINYRELVENSISKTIEDSSWYYYVWNEDPTVKSMLGMLDEIHNQFQSTTNLYQKLIRTEEPIITFQFLNLDSFKLTDDLYIKMNARGKQLTPFENFKAKFEQHIKSLNLKSSIPYSLKFGTEEKQVSVVDYFSFKIDTDWSNLFWNYKNTGTHSFDIQLMNFIRVIATNAFASKRKEEGILKRLVSNEDITFSGYMQLDCLDSEMVSDLIQTLNLLENGNERIKKYLTDISYYNEDTLFEKCIGSNLSYAERIRFYSFYKYLILNNGLKTGLQDWVRVIYNLTENTIFNEVGEYAEAIYRAENLLIEGPNILEFLKEDRSRFSGFLEIQVTEERIKACLILKSDLWRDLIIATERHGYYKGQISFILNFSGIEDYYNSKKNCDWSEEDNVIYLTSFKLYKDKADSVFGEKGLKVFNSFLFERALLSKGNYLLYTRANYSFLKDDDRDISWKRLLRDNNNGKRNFVKQLFDDVLFDHSKVIESLNSIIQASKITDWRQYFIELPELIGYLGTNKFIRMHSETNINLLKKERLNSSHIEYYTYSFYIKYIVSREIDFVPFTNLIYEEVSIDAPSFIKIGGWKYKGLEYGIDIKLNSTDGKYQLMFHDTTNSVIEPNILELLIMSGFHAGGNTMSFTKQNELHNILIVLCKNIMSLNDE